jgi:Protein of unknown function (DUF1553)/Protein of unknown function (DUF1549)/Planctomycete cytochrome C
MPERYFPALFLCSALAAVAQAAPVSFNRDIRPIMSDTCFRCHGPDKSSRMANFRLDIRAEALKPLRDGAVPIVPGDPEHSAIVQRVMAATPGKRMPPQAAHKDLTENQKDLIRRWVAEGAVYEGHWAYMPVVRPQISSSTGNPIDSLVRDRLRAAGLSPSPEADRATLIRRVTLDLTGLIPSPAEVISFQNDRSPLAYEKLVDRLLASPRYAEQRTMHWLDAVRYADTCGFHGDNIVPAWPYRDYVLNSFRDNKPFDEFTREQLAGDLLPGATLEHRTASAYNRLNRTSAEGGLQPNEYLAKYGADRVRTVSVAWLGSTMGCAECHDHKFDPFLTKDFYAMKAFFADIDETGLMPDRGEKAWGTQLELATAEQKRAEESLGRQIKTATIAWEEKAKLVSESKEARQALFRRWESGELSWKFQRPEAARSLNGSTLTVYNDQPVKDTGETTKDAGKDAGSRPKPGNGLIVATGANPDNETYIVTLRPGKGSWTALGVGVEQDESLPGNQISRGADRFVLTGLEASLQEPGKPERKLAFSLAAGDQSSRNGMPAMALLDDDARTGWGVELGESNVPFVALRFAERLQTNQDTRIVVRLRQDSLDYRRAVIGRFRLALSSAEYSWPGDGKTGNRDKDKLGEKGWAGGVPMPALSALRAEFGTVEPDPKESEKTEKEKTEEREAAAKSLHDYLQWSDPQLTALRARLDSLLAAQNLLQASVTRVVTTVSVTPRETRILPRGNWMDDTGAVVEPAIPEMFGKLETGGKRATRLDLANWIVSPKNPLTARAFVNRTWREFFGIGISKTLDDLGSQGEWPTNPELLDWLASEFVHPTWSADGAHAWDVKHLIRTIVLSQAYRQSSVPTAEMLEKDPENRLFARQSRFRVDAENVRDIALELSGLLNEKFGGPSAKPYQPDGYLATLNFPKREYSASRGEDLYRRGVYTMWRRTFLHPELLNFDAPTREECTVNRTISNTPLQALDLLNDPTFVEAARVFAEHAIRKPGTLDQRLHWIFQESLNRSPTPEEQRILAKLFQDNLKRFTAAPEEARRLAAVGEAPLPKAENVVQLAAMTMVTRAVLNLHETITRN